MWLDQSMFRRELLYTVINNSQLHLRQSRQDLSMTGSEFEMNGGDILGFGWQPWHEVIDLKQLGGQKV